MKASLVLCTLIFLLVIGCAKKVEPVPVGEMSEYRDPGYGFRIKYPKDWKQLGTTGKAVFARSQEVLNRFLDPKTGEEGAQVVVEVLKLDGKPASEVIERSRADFKQQIPTLAGGPDEQTTVGGKPATKVPYSVRATTKTNITGYQIYVQGDTAVYKLAFEGYGDQYGAHAALFDAMLASFELPVIVAAKPGTWAPAGSTSTYKSNFFTMEYPENMEFVNVKKGPKDDLAMEMRADRLDCSIHIDVFGAQKLTVEKVWEQNKGRYSAKATGQAKIEDQNAFWVDYVPRKDIGSRAYFVVKNDKVIRITINYFSGQKEVYFPVFEYMVKSIKLK